MRKTVLAAKVRAEYLFDLFFREKIAVEKPRTEGKETVFSVAAQDGARAVALLTERNVPVRTIKDGSQKTAVKNLLTRAGLFIGGALCVAVSFVYSATLTRVEIRGNERIPTETIETTVKDHLVLPQKRSSTKIDEIARAVKKTDGIAHASVYVVGNVLHVDVVEELEKAQLFDRNDFCDVTAKYDATVTRVIVYDGAATVQKDSVVKVGDPLISSRIPLDESGELFYQTRPFGEIYGVVRFTKELVFPDTRVVTERTGNQKTYSSFFLWTDKKSPYKLYETDYSENYLYNVFPFKIAKTTFYELKEVRQNFDFSANREGILKEERRKWEKELPAGFSAREFSYEIKRVDKTTFLSLYYDVEIKIN